MHVTWGSESWSFQVSAAARKPIADIDAGMRSHWKGRTTWMKVSVSRRRAGRPLLALYRTQWPRGFQDTVPVTIRFVRLWTMFPIPHHLFDRRPASSSWSTASATCTSGRSSAPSAHCDRPRMAADLPPLEPTALVNTPSRVIGMMHLACNASAYFSHVAPPPTLAAAAPGHSALRHRTAGAGRGPWVATVASRNASGRLLCIFHRRRHVAHGMGPAPTAGGSALLVPPCTAGLHCPCGGVWRTGPSCAVGPLPGGCMA
jgi:hypothetical protein